MKTEMITLRIEPKLKEKLKKEAENKRLSLGQYITIALIEKLERKNR